MIIHRIRAQNVLKYAELSIDVAPTGLVAISGQNESGKSSIGETVCFALFGRTFSITPDEIEKVVRWGENHCSVSLEFAVEDQGYVLSRFLDRDGNHSAKLALAEDPNEPIARGVQGVADTLFPILGFEFSEFVESFYLAQREITTPHPHSHAVKIMAGVAPLEDVQRCLNNEIAEREELLGELQAEWDSVDQDVQGLGIQDGRMPRLEDERHQTDVQIREIDALVAEIDAGVATCNENTSRIYSAEGSKGRAGFLRFIVLLLALAAAAVWALLTYAPDHPQAEVARGLLAQYVPQWGPEKTIWIGYVAAALGVLFLLLWIRIAGLRGRIRALREESAQFGSVLERARAIEVEERSVGDSGGDPDDEAGEAAVDDAESSFPARPDADEYRTLRRLLDSGEATARMAKEYGEREAGWLRAVSSQLSDQLVELDEEIDEEQARVQEAMDLADVLNGLTDKREELAERIADRHRGLELLDGAIAQLSSGFNRDVKDLVGRLLPLFTDGRYEHLQIDEGLKVRVFSSEKRDFMDLDEVSSGTQRQIMLALRLALSKKLLSRTVKGKQFAFLDEPFAFFDQERTRKALHALADLGDDISQVWIVAQDFPEHCEVHFDTTVFCERGSDTLKVES
ncbi:MAG: AAA family ATPase [Gammaproteobacteria bacterium]|nr:AAA family ATPase [Gammaproteobacteria bacterium]